MHQLSLNFRARIIIALAAASSFLGSVRVAFAEDGFSAQSALNEVRGSLREEIRQLVVGLDAEAHVDVFVTPIEPAVIKLPGTLTIVQENTITRDGNLPQFKTIEVMIFSNLEKLPTAAEELLRRQVSMFTKDVQINLKPPLQGFKVPASNVKIEAASFDEFKDNAATVAIVLIGFGLILLLGVAYIGRQLRVQSIAVQQSAQSLVQALESASLGAAGSGGNRPQVSSMTRDNIPMLDGDRGDGRGSSNDVLLELSDAGIAALIGDAYWCERDGYAAYVWRKLPVARKQVLLGGLEFARDYASYLANVPEIAEQWEQHPYYLNPLPIWNFDNKQMASVIRLYPSVIAALSPMRLASLPFPSSELVALRERSRMQQTASPDYSKIQVSAPRRLQTGALIRSKDENDDENLLSMQHVTANTMREVVSLVWAMQVPKKDLEEILRDFTASDLASAWTAPAAVLEKMGSALPEKKLKMVNSYVERAVPSRNSAAFLRLHQMFVERIASQVEILKDQTEDMPIELPRSA